MSDDDRMRLEVNGGAPVVHEHHTQNPHSVELTLTSAGKIGATVKVYDDDPGKAFERATAILDKVRLRYPQQG